MNNEALFKNLRNLRISYNLTQDDIAKILGKDRSLIAKYESGKAVPPLDILRVLAKLYNVSVDSLCGGVEGTDDTLVLNSDTIKNATSIMNESEDEIIYINENSGKVIVVSSDGEYLMNTDIEGLNRYLKTIKKEG